MFRLVYKSTCRGEMNREIVREILHKSGEHNKKAGITGALLATDTHFLQVLEGDFKTLNHTFSRIMNDERHTEVLLVAFGPADSRLFEGWAMRGIGVFDLNRDLEHELMEKYGSEDGSVCFPTKEWAALALIHDVHMMSSVPCEG